MGDSTIIKYKIEYAQNKQLNLIFHLWILSHKTKTVDVAWQYKTDQINNTTQQIKKISNIFEKWDK